ncbi:MAG: PEGA domain-containing protein [Polyangiaceae bacterium]|nr:PEGA domain-containing protein [Polyangiaceae bacterium]
MHGRLVACSLSLALAAATGLAWAEPKAEAREHFDRAMALVDQGALEQAIVEFRRAYDLMPHYTVLFNIGQAYVALGRPVEAVDAYTRYLEEGAERATKARRAEVESELLRQKAKIGEITVRVEPPGARVSVDGEDVGQAPLGQPVRLAEGSHTIEASLAGHDPATSQVSVVGQGQQTVELVLRPVSAAAQAEGLLRVDCPVPDVSVSIDGTVVARTPLAAPRPVAAGTRRVSFSRPGYVSHEQTVTLVPGGTTAVNCGVARVAPVPREHAAGLMVRPSESGARVEVDGTVWRPSEPLPSGPHWITVTRVGFERWQSEVELRPGITVDLVATLVPEAEYRSEYEARARRQRVWALAGAGGGVALGVAALGVYLWNDNRYDRWSDEHDALEGARSASGSVDFDALDRRRAENDDLLDAIHTVDAVTVAMGVTGGVLLATGAVLHLTGDDPNRYEVTAGAGPGSARIAAHLDF